MSIVNNFYWGGTMKKKIRITCIVLACTLLTGLILVFGLNMYVRLSTEDKLISNSEAKQLEQVDCIIVLGAGVWKDNEPSPMLKDRLNKAIELYQAGVSPKLIMSGDHGTKTYDEVNVMKEYAVSHGIDESDIFMDHAGFSTYDSMYRMAHIFDVKKAVIVTQQYHLYRAVYIANQLGVDGYGVATDDFSYGGQMYRELREIVARDKDFVQTLFKPEASIMGDKISLNQDAKVTKG